MKKFVIMLFAVVIALSFSGSVFADDDVTPPDSNAEEQMIPTAEEPSPPVVTAPESVPEPAPSAEPAPEPAPEPTSEAAPPEQPEAETVPESR